MHGSRFYLEDVTEPESSQSKDNLGLMERLTSEATAHSQALDRLQALEAKLEKLTNEKASWEARARNAEENASLVSGGGGSGCEFCSRHTWRFSFSFQTIAQLQENIDSLHLEKKNLEKRFEESSTLANGNVVKKGRLL